MMKALVAVFIAGVLQAADVPPNKQTIANTSVPDNAVLGENFNVPEMKSLYHSYSCEDRLRQKEKLVDFCMDLYRPEWPCQEPPTMFSCPDDKKLMKSSKSDDS